MTNCCSEKACVLPALPGAALCRHHALLFGGEVAFQSNGHRATVETVSEQELLRRRKRAREDQRAVREARARISRPRYRI